MGWIYNPTPSISYTPGVILFFEILQNGNSDLLTNLLWLVTIFWIFQKRQFCFWLVTIFCKT